MARVFFVTGSKGGVGKSVGSIGLLDYLEMRNRKVSLVETDTANPDVGKAYQKDVKSFSLVNLDENEGWLDLLDIVDASKGDDVVVNTAARNNEGVNRHGSMFDEKLHEFGWPFITLFLINQQRDSCEMLSEYINVVKYGRIHVVRNRFFGIAPSLFELYDSSALRKSIETREGLSLYLPQLATRVTNLVQSNRLTLEKAWQTATLGSRAEIERWRRECAQNIFDKVCDDDFTK
jgi:hypothetical protein